MHLGQTMLALGALVLLSISVVNTNRMIVDSDQETYQAEALDYAVSLSKSLFGEIATKKFDANATDTTYQSESQFTLPSGLGPASGEVLATWPDSAYFSSIPTYNDVDDYNAYERMVNTARIKGFKVTAQVYYVTDSNTDDPAAVQTYYKKVIVSVEHPIYLKKVSFSTIVSY